MNKAGVLEKIRAAKRSHVGWVRRARSLIDGLPVDKEKVPVQPTDCIFGQWYYGDGKMLAKLASFQAIEEPHNRLHETYSKIFKLLFGDAKPSFFSKMLGLKYKPKENELTKANELFKELQAWSDIIVGRLGKLEDQIKAMPEREPS